MLAANSYCVMCNKTLQQKQEEFRLTKQGVNTMKHKITSSILLMVPLSFLGKIQASYSQVHLVAQLLMAIHIQFQQDLKHGQALLTKMQLSIHSASRTVVKLPLQVQLLEQT